MTVLRLTAFAVHNFKGARRIEIEPGDRHLIVLQGRNEQGKTSALDALSWAFSGHHGRPNDVIHHGADAAEVVIDLDGEVDGRPEQLRIRREYANSRERLTIETADGRKWGSPQSLLNRLVERQMLDPMRFHDAHPKEQRAMVLRAIGLGDDLDRLTAEHQQIYSARTEVHRQQRDAEGEAERIGQPAVIPDEVDVTALIERRAEMASPERERKRLEEDAAREHREARACERRRLDLVAEIEALQRLIEEKDRQSSELTRREAKHRQASDQLTAKAKDVQIPATWALDDQIEQAKATNAKRAAAMEQARRYRDAANHAASHKARYQELSDELGGIEARKVAALEQAQQAVPGLGIDGDQLTFEGALLANVSTSQRMRVSLTIAQLLRPALRVVWLDRAESLDDDALASVEAWARDNDTVAIMTRVGTGDSDAITIEAGEIAQ